MEVNQETVAHLAELSNIALTDKEKANLSHDLNHIVQYISQLDELNTDNVEPTYQVFEMENVWREDEILEQDASPEQLLELTQDVEDQQIKVPKVL